MGTIPAYPTFTAGEIPTAAKLNQQRDAGNFWGRTPRCYAYQSTIQSLTNNVWGLIALQSEVYDYVQSGDTAAHDLVTDNSRVYIRTSGIYELSGQVQIATNATGVRQAQIRLNAGGSSAAGSLLAVNQQSPVTGASTSVGIIPVEVPLVAGDYVEIFGFQNSGGALNTVAGQGVTFLKVKMTGSP